MAIDDKLKELHNLGIIARNLLGKDEAEPKTNYKLLPNGKAVITFYSSCFSFISNNLSSITIYPEELDTYIERARNEVQLYKSIANHSGASLSSFKSKPYIIPIIICTTNTKRIYKIHLCKEHRKDALTYRPRCSCYITWEEFGETDE